MIAADVIVAVFLPFLRGLAGLQGNMPKRRKLVVKEAFERLSLALRGSITVQDIRQVIQDHRYAVTVAPGLRKRTMV